MRPYVAAFLLLLTSAPISAQAPPAVIAAERAWAGADVLLPLAHSPDTGTAVAALRALGRLHDRALVEPLLEFDDGSSPEIRDAAASALAQTLITTDPRTDGALLSKVIDRLLQHRQWGAAAVLPMPDADRAGSVEGLIDDVLKRAQFEAISGDERDRAAKAFESLARRNAKLKDFSLRPPSIGLLEKLVVERYDKGVSAIARRYALWTLIEARAATASALRAGLSDRDDQTRRIALQALGAETSVLNADERAAALRNALRDPSIIVRVEAVRSFAKHATAAGSDCAALLDVLRDGAAHVVNGALDALGSACPQDERVTDRLAQEAVAPPASGLWQRQAHALVALAARSPSKAARAVHAFAVHPVWEVRMYAARAAAALKDEATLARLAFDESDNVRSAALPPLHQISAERSRPAVLAALDRPDYQVIRTAATLLKDEAPSRDTGNALLAALQRVSQERRQTSRDARLPLLDALAVHGTAEQADALGPLLTDADPLVAVRVAALLRQWGHPAKSDSALPRHDARAPFGDASTCVAIEMAHGGRMRLQPDAAAPVTAEAFLDLALNRHFYDGRTFHRVEPNFVVQGGSPGANEYSSGLDTFLRDEIGAPNVRGGVGLSTRGIDTADGQIYLLLVDEPRLDGRYTIFAHVFDSADDMRTLDTIEEGDRITRVARTNCARD